MKQKHTALIGALVLTVALLVAVCGLLYLSLSKKRGKRFYLPE